MKIGDLVCYWHDDDRVTRSAPGIVVDFDRDDDPIVWFIGVPQQPAPYFRQDMEIISEGR